MIGQDAVFDRSEQRRDDAEHQQGRHQHRDRRQRDAGDGDSRGGNLGEFQPPGDEGLVKAVGDLAAKRGQQQEGRHEDGPRQSDQRSRLIGGQREKNQEHQRVLEEIVIEGGQELRPEQGRKAPGQHQMRVHGDFHLAEPYDGVPEGPAGLQALFQSQ